MNFDWINELLSNRMILTAFIAWFLAQFIKLVLHFIANKEVKTHLILESGGMPSSHSSTICSVCVAIGNAHGYDSSIFALAMVMAIIVMYDAVGVRRATGEQGKVLNKIIDMMNINNKFQTTLKEAMGHTPIEVFAGAILGIAVGILFS